MAGMADLMEIVDDILAESTMTVDELVASLEAAELGW